MKPMPVSVAPSSLAKCLEMPQAASASVDDYLVLEGIMTDLYTQCALKHNTLVDEVNAHNKEATNGGR